jgi:hypothetical protein
MQYPIDIIDFSRAPESLPSRLALKVNASAMEWIADARPVPVV